MIDDLANAGLIARTGQMFSDTWSSFTHLFSSKGKEGEKGKAEDEADIAAQVAQLEQRRQQHQERIKHQDPAASYPIKWLQKVSSKEVSIFL